MATYYEREYNDERLYANRFTQSVEGALGSFNDVDWFVYTVAFPTTLKLTYTLPSSGSWNIYVFDERLQALSGRNQSGNLTFNLAAYSVGDYYFRVQTSLPNGVLYNQSPYQITVEAPQFTVIADRSRAVEGDQIRFSVVRTGFDYQDTLTYTLSGVSPTDVLTSLRGVIPLDSSGRGTLTVQTAQDDLVEGIENLTLSIGFYTGGVNPVASRLVDIPGATATVALSDPPAPQVTTVNGSAGNDILGWIPSSGPAVINAGLGLDVLQVPGPRSSYAADATRLVHLETGRTAQLIGVERAVFSDGGLAFDLSTTGAAGQAVLTLGAVLPGQLALDPSKQALVGSVMKLLDQGLPWTTLCGAVMRLDIWSALTGKAAPSARDVAGYLLQNVLGAPPSTPELDAAERVLLTETVQGTWLAALASSSASQLHIGLVGLASTGLPYSG